ncbi:hypothetical protein Q5P01_007017 [Channa striata]|uniref:small monomeric GTPase n=1 Tax=Channa striata TaxID=64152 RepID=A0AA88SWJ3_CHASR|nr:hypothetical protein Q5P01_007017 [Channa striata]
MAKTYDYLLKLLLIGDSGVGKTCLLFRFSEDAFNTTFISTIGIDFKIRTIELDGKKIKLQIWDTAGQERFRTITTAYYRGAMGIMLVYDITNEKSFDNIRNWIRNIEEHASSDVERMVLGNKCDINDKRQVSKERGEKLAIDYGIKFLETSAKSSINVEEAFYTLARDIMSRLNRKMNDSTPSGGGGPVKITESRSKKSFFRLTRRQAFCAFACLLLSVVWSNQEPESYLQSEGEPGWNSDRNDCQTAAARGLGIPALRPERCHSALTGGGCFCRQSTLEWTGTHVAPAELSAVLGGLLQLVEQNWNGPGSLQRNQQFLGGAYDLLSELLEPVTDGVGQDGGGAGFRATSQSVGLFLLKRKLERTEQQLETMKRILVSTLTENYDLKRREHRLTSEQ